MQDERDNTTSSEPACRLVSVDERLPEHDGKYLVWRAWKSSGVGSWSTAFYFTEDRSWLDDSASQDDPPIRHWAGLPQPPTGYRTRYGD
jgi:hypothetical protein